MADSAPGPAARPQSVVAHHRSAMRRARGPPANAQAHQFSPTRPQPLSVTLFLLTALLLLTSASCQSQTLYMVCQTPHSKTECVTWPLESEEANEFMRELIKMNGESYCEVGELHLYTTERNVVLVKLLNDESNILYCSVSKMKMGNLIRSRRQASYRLRGRYRGQTQSQYLSIDRGNGKDEGKAEAHSAADSSRAIVSGNSGMGQAQSQTIYDPNCEDCIGRTDQDGTNQINGPNNGHGSYGPSNQQRTPGGNYITSVPTGGTSHSLTPENIVSHPGIVGGYPNGNNQWNAAHPGRGVPGHGGMYPGQEGALPGHGGLPGQGGGLPGQGAAISSHGGLPGQGGGLLGQGGQLPGQGQLLPGQGGVPGQGSGLPGQGGVLTGQGGGLPGQGGGIPGQEGILPGQGGVILGQGGGLPGQVGGLLGQGDGKPGQGGVSPGQGGMSLGQGGGLPGQGGGMPGQGRLIPGQGGVFPGQAGGLPGHGSVLPGQGGGLPGHGVVYPGQSAGLPGQSGGLPGQGGGLPGQGAVYSGNGGGLPAQGRVYPGHGGIPGHGEGLPGQGTGLQGQTGVYPGQGNALTDQGGGQPGQGGRYPGQEGGIPGQGSRLPNQGGQPGQGVYSGVGGLPGQGVYSGQGGGPGQTGTLHGQGPQKSVQGMLPQNQGNVMNYPTTNSNIPGISNLGNLGWPVLTDLLREKGVVCCYIGPDNQNAIVSGNSIFNRQPYSTGSPGQGVVGTPGQNGYPGSSDSYTGINKPSTPEQTSQTIYQSPNGPYPGSGSNTLQYPGNGQNNLLPPTGQYPGASQNNLQTSNGPYPGSGQANLQYPSRYPGISQTNLQSPTAQYPGSGQTNAQYPPGYTGTGQNNLQSPGGQFPGTSQNNLQSPSGQYPGQTNLQYPTGQYPGTGQNNLQSSGGQYPGTGQNNVQSPTGKGQNNLQSGSGQYPGSAQNNLQPGGGQYPGSGQNNLQPGGGQYPGSGQNNLQPGGGQYPGSGQNNLQSGGGQYPGSGQNNLQSGGGQYPGSSQNNLQSGGGQYPGTGQNNLQSGGGQYPGSGQNNMQSGGGQYPGPDRTNLQSGTGPYPGLGQNNLQSDKGQYPGSGPNNLQSGGGQYPGSGQTNLQTGTDPYTGSGPNNLQSGTGQYPVTGLNNLQPGTGQYPGTGSNNLHSGAGQYPGTGQSGTGQYPGTGPNNVQSGTGQYPSTSQNNLQSGTGPYPGSDQNNLQAGSGQYPQNNLQQGAGQYPGSGQNNLQSPTGQYLPGQNNFPLPNGQYPAGQNNYQPGVNQGQGYGIGQGVDNQGNPIGNNEYSGEPQNVLDPNSKLSTIDDYDSQAQASVSQAVNGTTALASSKGGNEKGRAQTQVEGTYTGTGSFSANAEISDDNKAAQSHVSGSKKGASGSAEGKGRKNKSQASVQLGSETGSILTDSQSTGDMHSSSSQVQGSIKGGMADAQAKGPGSTSSQAQIGFTPYKEKDKEKHDLLKAPFEGGGTASAQSSGRMGTSQSQLRGTFKYGISYNGAAQAGSSLDKDAVFSNLLPFDKIDVYDESNKNINVDISTTEEPSDSPQNWSENNNESTTEINDENTNSQNADDNLTDHVHSDHHKNNQFNITSLPPPASYPPADNPPAENLPVGNRRSFQNNYGSTTTNGADYEYPTDKEIPEEYDIDDGFGSDGADNAPVEQGEYSNYDDIPRDTDATHQSLQNPNKKSYEIKQTTGGNTQHIILGSLNNHDAKIIQRNSEHPDEKRVYQPGERVPGMGGYTIPAGFTGSVKSVASKEKTYVVGSKYSPSQAQTVNLTPGTGKVKYVHPGNYGQNVNPHDLRSLHSKPDNNRYVSVSKSVTRDLDIENNIRKQYSHTYFTKSSSCGYFTFTCTMVSSAEGKKKVCKPKIPTNPDGTPMRC